MLMMLLFVDIQMKDILEWFSELCSPGPQFGYFHNPSKSFLLVSDKFRSDADCLVVWVFGS